MNNPVGAGLSAINFGVALDYSRAGPLLQLPYFPHYRFKKDVRII